MCGFILTLKNSGCDIYFKYFLSYATTSLSLRFLAHINNHALPVLGIGIILHHRLSTPPPDTGLDIFGILHIWYTHAHMSPICAYQIFSDSDM